MHEPNDHEFLSILESYLVSLRKTSVTLFRLGVAHDRCIPIAAQIVDAQDERKLRELHEGDELELAGELEPRH